MLWKLYAHICEYWQDTYEIILDNNKKDMLEMQKIIVSNEDLGETFATVFYNKRRQQ